MTTKSDDTAAVLAGVLIVPLIAALAIYRGWFLAILWRWFVTPTFGIHELSIAQAIGVTMVASTLAKDGRKSDEKGLEWFAGQALFPLFALGVAWIVKQFL